LLPGSCRYPTRRCRGAERSPRDIPNAFIGQAGPPTRRLPPYGAQAQRFGNNSWIGWQRNRASGSKNRSPSRSNGSSRGSIPSFIYLPAMDASGWCLFSATERLRRRDREIFLKAWPKRWRTLLDTGKQRECRSSWRQTKTWPRSVSLSGSNWQTNLRCRFRSKFSRDYSCSSLICPIPPSTVR
jgi:hypothetical protein